MMDMQPAALAARSIGVMQQATLAAGQLEAGTICNYLHATMDKL
jgi:hypothetical protein